MSDPCLRPRPSSLLCVRCGSWHVFAVPLAVLIQRRGEERLILRQIYFMLLLEKQIYFQNVQCLDGLGRGEKRRGWGWGWGGCLGVPTLCLSVVSKGLAPPTRLELCAGARPLLCKCKEVMTLGGTLWGWGVPPEADVYSQMQRGSHTPTAPAWPPSPPCQERQPGCLPAPGWAHGGAKAGGSGLGPAALSPGLWHRPVALPSRAPSLPPHPSLSGLPLRCCCGLAPRAGVQMVAEEGPVDDVAPQPRPGSPQDSSGAG